MSDASVIVIDDDNDEQVKILKSINKDFRLVFAGKLDVQLYQLVTQLQNAMDSHFEFSFRRYALLIGQVTEGQKLNEARPSTDDNILQRFLACTTSGSYAVVRTLSLFKQSNFKYIKDLRFHHVLKYPRLMNTFVELTQSIFTGTQIDAGFIHAPNALITDLEDHMRHLLRAQVVMEKQFTLLVEPVKDVSAEASQTWSVFISGESDRVTLHEADLFSTKGSESDVTKAFDPLHMLLRLMMDGTFTREHDFVARKDDVLESESSRAGNATVWDVPLDCSVDAFSFELKGPLLQAFVYCLNLIQSIGEQSANRNEFKTASQTLDWLLSANIYTRLIFFANLVQLHYNITNARKRHTSARLMVLNRMATLFNHIIVYISKKIDPLFDIDMWRIRVQKQKRRTLLI
jgi:hypothetical protein